MVKIRPFRYLHRKLTTFLAKRKTILIIESIPHILLYLIVSRLCNTANTFITSDVIIS